MEVKKVKNIKKNSTKDVYKNRLIQLVNIAIKKLEICKTMYLEISTFKRTNALNRELKKSAERFIVFRDTSKKPNTLNPPKTEPGLILDRNYIYMGDSKTRTAYNFYNGKIVKLVQFRPEGPLGAHDSNFWEQCKFRVIYNHYGTVYTFWTRRECLIPQRHVSKEG